jgi:hypothetical protein
LEDNGHVNKREVPEKDRVLTGTNSGSLHSLSSTTVYQDSVLYLHPSQVHSHPEGNVYKYLTFPATTETSLVPKIPQLPKQYQSSHMRTNFDAEGSSESPPRPNQMTGYESPIRQFNH